MPKLIMLVDSDAALRGQAVKALTARGYEVQESIDGRDVVEQVRAAQPQVLVLCVELPRGSGYAICSKLKKDEGLKHIPVLLTSSEATPKAFDDHKKLKFGHADAYLLKPFSTEVLIHQLLELLGDDDSPVAEPHAAILGLADLAEEFGDHRAEEQISVDEIEEISVEDDLAPTSASLPGESDVDLLETAFDKLEDPFEQRGDQDDTKIHRINGNRDTPYDAPVSLEDEDTGSADAPDEALLDETDSLLAQLEGDEPLNHGPNGFGAVDDPLPKIGGFRDSPKETTEPAELPLARSQPTHAEPLLNAAPRSSPSSRGPQTAFPPARTGTGLGLVSGGLSDESARPLGSGGRDREYFQLKERLEKREKDLVRLREELTEKEKELLEQRERETNIERELADKDDEMARREAQGRQLQQKIDALVAGQRKTDKDLLSAREEARSAVQRATLAESAQASAETEAHARQEAWQEVSQQLAETQKRVEGVELELERQRNRGDELEAELGGVRAQLDEAHSTLDDLRAQGEQRQEDAQRREEDLRRRLSTTEDERQKHEDRLVKAYARLKDGDKIRDKARKAIGIALQLLEEAPESEEPESDQDEQHS